MKTRSPEQSIVGHETQWTQPWPRVRSQVDVIHLVRSTGAIVSNPHLHSVESCPEKSRPIKHGGQLHGLIIDNRGREAPGIGVFKFLHVLSAPRPQDDATIFQFKTSTADLKFLSIA